MIRSGFFDRCTKLKIIAAHAGGAQPFLAGRLDICWENMPAARENGGKAQQLSAAGVRRRGRVPPGRAGHGGIGVRHRQCALRLGQPAQHRRHEGVSVARRRPAPAMSGKRCAGATPRKFSGSEFQFGVEGVAPSLTSGRIEIPAQAGRPRGRHAPRPDGGNKLPTVDLHQMQGQGADYPVSRSERTILIVRAECIADVVLKSCHALSAKQCIEHTGHMGSPKSDDRHRSRGSNAAVSLIRRNAS